MSRGPGRARRSRSRRASRRGDQGRSKPARPRLHRDPGRGAGPRSLPAPWTRTSGRPSARPARPPCWVRRRDEAPLRRGADLGRPPRGPPCSAAPLLASVSVNVRAWPGAVPPGRGRSSGRRRAPAPSCAAAPRTSCGMSAWRRPPAPGLPEWLQAGTWVRIPTPGRCREEGEPQDPAPALTWTPCSEARWVPLSGPRCFAKGAPQPTKGVRLGQPAPQKGSGPRPGPGSCGGVRGKPTFCQTELVTRPGGDGASRRRPECRGVRVNKLPLSPFHLSPGVSLRPLSAPTAHLRMCAKRRAGGHVHPH